MRSSRLRHLGFQKHQVLLVAMLTTSALVSCSTEQATQPDAAAQLQSRYIEAVRKVTPSVVKIKVQFEPEPGLVLIGYGSGIVLDSKGDVLTNAHVVTAGATSANPKRTPATQITVAAKGGLDQKAVLVGCFVRSDVAVIRADNADLLPARLGDSNKLQVGQIVMAVGSPENLDGTVTTGIVSALDRVESEGAAPYAVGAPLAPSLPGMIQTSAQINHGNSGGALVDLDGRVVGIPTLTLETGATQTILGDVIPGSSIPAIGFAIGISKAKDYADQILKSGKVTDSHLGILGLDFDRYVVDGLARPGGVVVKALVSGAGAENAGIRTGDLITSVNGKDTLNVVQYLDAIAPLKPGEAVPVGTVRGGSTQIVKVKLSPYVDSEGCTGTL